MSETITDESGTIEVEIVDGRAEALRISAQWRDRFDASSLGEAISHLIRGALPPRAQLRMPQPGPPKNLPMSSVSAYLAEMQAARRAMRRYIARLKTGEVFRDADVRHVDPEKRVETSMVGGRFNAVFLNPEWADEASLQALCDTIRAALPAPLVQEPQPDTDVAEARKHYAAARAYLIEQ